MKVSVLMPSRGRPDLAKKSVESLGKGDFEVLLALDNDDPMFGHYSQITGEHHAFNRKGYGALHEYYNLLSEWTKGDWLMLWNDDTIMETPDWVEKIAQYDHTIPQVLNPWSENGDNLFPLISRKWYEIVGHFSLNTHADSWVQQIGQRLDIQVYVPGIKITHQGDNLNDQTHSEVKQVVRETSNNYGLMENLRINDAEKIRIWYENNKVSSV